MLLVQNKQALSHHSPLKTINKQFSEGWENIVALHISFDPWRREREKERRQEKWGNKTGRGNQSHGLPALYKKKRKKMLSRWDLGYRGLLCPERSIRVNEFSMYYYLRVEKIEDEIFFTSACLTLVHNCGIRNVQNLTVISPCPTLIKLKF